MYGLVGYAWIAVIAVGRGRWEDRGEERNMADGGGQMAASRRTGNTSRRRKRNASQDILLVVNIELLTFETFSLNKLAMRVVFYYINKTMSSMWGSCGSL